MSGHLYVFRCRQCEKTYRTLHPTKKVEESGDINSFNWRKEYSIGFTCIQGHFNWVASTHNVELVAHMKKDRKQIPRGSTFV